MFNFRAIAESENLLTSIDNSVGVGHVILVGLLFWKHFLQIVPCPT